MKKSRVMLPPPAALAIFTLLSATQTVRSQPFIAADFQGFGSISNYGTATGWWFKPNTDIVITHLGLYDLGSPGFESNHDVGVFSAAGSPLVTATLSAGSGAMFIPGTLAGSRVIPVANTLLEAGNVYYTAANNFDRDAYAFGPGIAFDPNLTWLGFSQADTNSIFSNVRNLGGEPGNIGPNFLFHTVPEPASSVLACLGALSLATVRRQTATATAGPLPRRTAP